MIYLLGVLLIAILCYLLWFLANIKNINMQLDFIVSHDTNKELKLSSNNKLLQELVIKNNKLIIKSKKNAYQRNIERDELQILISNILHDIRTPLTLASGYTQVLKEKTDNPNNEDQLNHILNSIDIASNQLEQLFLISRVLEDKRPELNELNLSSIVQEQSVEFYQALMDQRIDVSLNLMNDVYIFSSKKELDTLIANSLSNILKHAYSNASISLSKNNQKIILQFTNDIKKANIEPEKVFDRFYTTSADGSGLGLFIIKKITDRLNIKTHTEITSNSFTIQFIFENFFIREDTSLNK